MLPLAMIWLAAHVLVLALILGLKFLAAKTLLILAMVMLALAGAAVWFLAKRKRALPQLAGVV